MATDIALADLQPFIDDPRRWEEKREHVRKNFGVLVPIRSVAFAETYFNDFNFSSLAGYFLNERNMRRYSAEHKNSVEEYIYKYRDLHFNWDSERKRLNETRNNAIDFFSLTYARKHYVRSCREKVHSVGIPSPDLDFRVAHIAAEMLMDKDSEFDFREAHEKVCVIRKSYEDLCELAIRFALDEEKLYYAQLKQIALVFAKLYNSQKEDRRFYKPVKSKEI